MHFDKKMLLVFFFFFFFLCILIRSFVHLHYAGSSSSFSFVFSLHACAWEYFCFAWIRHCIPRVLFSFKVKQNLKLFTSHFFFFSNFHYFHLILGSIAMNFWAALTTNNWPLFHIFPHFSSYLPWFFFWSKTLGGFFFFFWVVLVVFDMTCC